MHKKTILFSTDFSTCGEAALGMATALARDWDAKMLIVHVEEPPLSYSNSPMYYGVVEPNRDDLWNMLEKVVPTDPSVEYEHRLISGAPSLAILKLAEDEAVELIVMGTHGRTGLNRMIMGSVAEDVLRHAPCPVLTFKEPETMSTES